MDENLSELVTKAESGDVEAQFSLGVVYSSGGKVVEDPKGSFGWFWLAAVHGHPKAQEAVANCFRSGYGVDKDATKAIDWYQSSADLGNAEALFMLGCCHSMGDGVPIDLGKAGVFYRKAADCGHLRAMWDIARQCMDEDGLKKDYAEALRWFDVALVNFQNADVSRHVAPHDVFVFSLIGRVFHEGVSEPDSSGAVIGKDLYKALRFYEIGAKAKCCICIHYILSMMKYPDPDFLYVVSDKDAIRWAFVGDSLGDCYSQSFIGSAYSEGRGLPKSANEAVVWWTKAASRGDCAAQFQLGLAYENGLGVAKDLTEAYVWLNLAAAGAYVWDASCSQARDRVEALLNPEQLISAQKKSTEIHSGFQER